MKKIWIIVIAVVLVLGGFMWYKFFFVFAEGVKSGYLNYANKKGYIFKTYEGRVVQEGFQSPTAGGLQSNEFRFSVVDSGIAEKLEKASGKFVELRYKEYNGMLPWRGSSNFVVTEVLTVNNAGKTDGSALPFDQ